MDAALVVETSGVWVRAVQAAGHPGCPLLLQQLGHDGLHRLRGLEHMVMKHIVLHIMMSFFLPKSPVHCLNLAPLR